MKISFHWNEITYLADLALPLHISIPLLNGIEKQANAFGAPLYEAYPLKAGSFVGSTDQGSPVNFFNVRVNPHGNGTHTESIGHITSVKKSVHDKLITTMCVAEVVSVFPTRIDGGDRIITREVLEELVRARSEALIIRTMPNEEDKRTRKYSGTNPPYFSREAMEWIATRGYQHLLTDLPSVDREEDGGALVAHKIFWGIDADTNENRTITEMIYVDNDIADGLYLLNLQIAPLGIDASPSRPVLFEILPE